MAAGSHNFALLCALLFAASASVSAAGGCSSDKFSSNRTFAHCLDLPQLNSSLHFTYDSAARSLSIAFVAPPDKPEGWVAWAINPTGGGMRGSQTLIGFHQADGTLAVKTYNISGYGPISEAPIAFDTSDLAAELSGGTMRIFGKLVLPKEMTTTTVEQVWQVGETVANGVPQKHRFDKENLESKGFVDLSNGVIVPSPAPAPAPAANCTSPPAPAPSASGSNKINVNGIGTAVALMVSLAAGFLFY
ncbi:auxin-induced in root cultures protein 12-like [Zingiber officinale]|uniref:auxin-induced in root cultures protein 12-like n=1 Tax=Zingiber officinale TaxID=94328 RepID=UPI001C4C3456|nr:auxin-induced in root cultures protein 12-like [Zingiber officinale]